MKKWNGGQAPVPVLGEKWNGCLAPVPVFAGKKKRGNDYVDN